MFKKISKSIILVSVITIFSTIILIIGSLYNYFTDLQIRNSKEHLDIVAVGVTQLKDDYLDKLDANMYRITWINQEGKVLFDSKADHTTMENHIDRAEVISAINYGTGQDKRVSKTLSEETIYVAKRLEDNTIIRASFTQLTIISLIQNMSLIIVGIAVISIIISTIISSKISKNIITPMNNLDLDNPLDNEVYEEMSPLLRRIDKQNEKITSQINDLKKQKEEINFIFDNIADGILIINECGMIISCNKIAKELLSCIENDYYLASFRELEYEELVENALKGNSNSIKLSINEGVYNLSASSIKSINDYHSVFIFIHNITEEDRALELRRQFTANVSHEIKTPLTTIMGASELLANGLVKDEDVLTFGNNIYKESERLLGLVQNIIKLSRLDEQKNFEFNIIDLNVITSDIIDKLNNKIKNKDITLSLNLIEAFIQANNTVIYEMLYNLLDNAIDYNVNKGFIDITIIDYKDSIKWMIKDSGVGIAKENLSRIFERFYRVDESHSKESGGSGLGLSIVKNGAILHNAKIDIESKVGEGTTITLIFNKTLDN